MSLQTDDLNDLIRDTARILAQLPAKHDLGSATEGTEHSDRGSHHFSHDGGDHKNHSKARKRKKKDERSAVFESRSSQTRGSRLQFEVLNPREITAADLEDSKRRDKSNQTSPQVVSVSEDPHGTIKQLSSPVRAVLPKVVIQPQKSDLLHQQLSSKRTANESLPKHKQPQQHRHFCSETNVNTSTDDLSLFPNSSISSSNSGHGYSISAPKYSNSDSATSPAGNAILLHHQRRSLPPPQTRSVQLHGESTQRHQQFPISPCSSTSSTPISPANDLTQPSAKPLAKLIEPNPNGLHLIDSFIPSNGEAKSNLDELFRKEYESAPKAEPKTENANQDSVQPDLPFQRRWKTINDLLARAGFPVMVNNGTTNEDEIVVQTFADLLSQFQERTKLAQEVINNSSLKEYRTTLAEKQQKRAENSSLILERQLKEVNNRYSVSSSEQDKTIEKQRKKLSDLTACISSVKRQLSHAKHSIRNKEYELTRAQQKLQYQLMKEEKRKSHGEALFHKLKHRLPRKNSLKDSESIELIILFETERKHMQKEIRFLRDEVGSLSSNLCTSNASERYQKYPTSSQLPEALNSPKLPNSSSLTKATETKTPTELFGTDWHSAKERNYSQHGKEKQALKAKAQKYQQEATSLRGQVKLLEDQCSNLQCELESRPSLRNWKLCQQQISKMKRQLGAEKGSLTVRKRLNAQHLKETADGIGSLNRQVLDHLSHDDCVEVLIEICRELEVSDVNLIGMTLKKLKKIVTAVPRMEQFIQSVCNVIANSDLEDSSHLKEKSVALIIPEIIPLLRRWVQELEQLSRLKSMKKVLERQLSERALKIPIGLNNSNERKSQFSALSATEITEQVNELIRSEDYLVNAKEVYCQAENDIQVNPSALPSRIIAHFQHLFSVKSLEGVFPKMNEIYLFVNEMENFLTSVRSLLHLDNSSSPTNCFSALRSLVDRTSELITSGPSPRGEAPNTTLVTETVTEIDNKDTLSSAAQLGSQSDQSVLTLLQSLEALFGVTDPLELAGYCERLVDRCNMFDSVFPQLDVLVSELRSCLGVNHLSEILPTIKQLLNNAQSHPPLAE